MNKLLAATAVLKAAFQEYNLDPPVAIVLKNEGEGQKLISCLFHYTQPQHISLVDVSTGQGVVRINGIEVRWPIL